MKKQIGTIVHYFPADVDGQIVDKNSAKSFPAVITQSFDESDAVNLCVFSWNGIAPVLNVFPVPENFDPEQPRDIGYFATPEPNESVDLGDAGERIMQSIEKTQKMIDEHAATFEAANKKVIDDVNHQIEVLTDFVNTTVKTLTDRMNEIAAGIKPKK